VTLLAVPNVSEGRDAEAVAAIGEAFAAEGARLLDVHRDPDHNRSVYTLAGEPGRLASALLSGGRETVARVDVARNDGVHPSVGALDVAPVVFASHDQRGAACAEALMAGELIGRELELPVLLYGVLAGGRTRSELRRDGFPELARRLESGELRPDFGPARAHPTAGATLVAARPPLVAFNLELSAGQDIVAARRVAGLVREGGDDGLPGVRALGLELPSRGVAQISFNVEDPGRTPLARLIEAVRRHAEVASAELVGLAPAAALEGFPADLPMPGFDPARHLIENALA
jgi:glutamate formiminotransferase / 5-formyltetrahydrofolate cyclo-ligase